MGESPPSLDRHEREAESSDPENTRINKVKFVTEADSGALTAKQSLGDPATESPLHPVTPALQDVLRAHRRFHE